MTWQCFAFVSVCLWATAHQTMRKKTALHEAAEDGDSERLQRLLDKGSYDVNGGDEDQV